MSNATTQIKFTIESDIVSSFKARCASQGVTMTSVIRQWMATGCPSSGVKTGMDTRPHRRKTVMEYIISLNELMCMESEYRDNIPEQFTQRYEAADHTCEQLAEALACLEDAY
jgi:hypothetical protein